MASKDLMKRHYSETLLAMCEEQPLSSVTVTALVARAGTAKQTFYNHFRDLSDLVNFIPRERLLHAGFVAFSPSAILASYKFAAEHKGFFGALPKHGGQNNFRDEFIRFSEEAAYKVFLTDGLTARERLERKLAIDLYTIGVVDHCLEWCSTGLEWDPEVLAHVHAQSAPAFMRENVDEG